jgi:hypothetical protein
MLSASGAIEMNNPDFADDRVASLDWSRTFRNMSGVLLFAAVTALGCASGAWGEESQTVDGVVRMAHIVTDRNPQIRSAEIRGYFPFPGQPNTFVWVLYRFESPDEYLLLVALAQDNATFFASDGKKTIFYDPEHKGILVVSNLVPTFQLQVKDNGLLYHWGFVEKSASSSNETAMDSPGKLLFDLPSLLRHPNVSGREVERVGDGRLRFILTAVNGDKNIATVDPTAPFQFTEFQGNTAEGQTWLKVRVNQALPPAPQLPEIETIRTMFGVEQTTVPTNIADLSRLLALTFVPVAAMGPPDSDLRQAVEAMSSSKPNWSRVEESLKRDLPKLRRLLPAR